MLRILFPGLTAETGRGAELFAALTAEARATHWYVEGAAPDTLDGRFAILATLCALALVRLEDAGEQQAAVALTERFIEVMESEHRELGLGDPKLGRTVRRLVGSLARRVGLWRQAIASGDWAEAARASAYGKQEPDADALAHTAERLRDTWSRIAALPADDLARGKLR
jgi:cytochrome b pre-mRNA-processing protein 3